MLEWNPGPPPAFAAHWENRPRYGPWNTGYRMRWGPIYYRGRLDSTAKVIVIGQNPTADENGHQACGLTVSRQAIPWGAK